MYASSISNKIQCQISYRITYGSKNLFLEF